MAVYLGDFAEDATVDFMWSTQDGSASSVTRATNGEVRVYRDNGVTQVTVGVTDTEDFDGLTGIHACTIDLSAHASYIALANYTVVLQGATIDGQVVNAVLAHFSIENRADIFDLANGVESGVTLRQALRLMLSALVGKLSGAATPTVRIRDTGDATDRIVATVDVDGNRSAVTLDSS